MTSPSIDIIVPVWNSRDQASDCLAAIICHSPEEARLIVVDNGCDHETGLLLEDFSDALGDRGLFIVSERNLGLLRAINMGLSHSDADIAIIICPNLLVSKGWLSPLLKAADASQTGIVTPLFSGAGSPQFPTFDKKCEVSETFSASLSAILLKAEMREQLGNFDEQIGNLDLCVKDYICRAWSKGYRTCVATKAKLAYKTELIFGSETWHQQLAKTSRAEYLKRWVAGKHYCIYFGAECTIEAIHNTFDTLLAACRQGHRFSLILHNRQASELRKRGCYDLHTSLDLVCLAPFISRIELPRKIASIRREYPEIIMVRWNLHDFTEVLEPTIHFKELEAAISCKTYNKLKKESV